MAPDNTNLVPFNCPVCNAVLQEVSQNIYQCPLGHIYSLQDLIANQHREIEKDLWTVYRSMTQRTNMLTMLAQQEPALNNDVEQQLLASTTAQTMVLGLLQMYK
jgi:hypothetical protein